MHSIPLSTDISTHVLSYSSFIPTADLSFSVPVSISYIVLKIILFIFFVCMYVYVCLCGVGMGRYVPAIAHERRSEDNLRESFLSFYHVGHEDQTQVIRLS